MIPLFLERTTQMPFNPGVFLSLKPSDTSAHNSASLLMGGLGAQTNAARFSAGGTGRMVFILTGSQTADANARTTATQLSYGTGTAPAALAAVAGTQVGGSLAWVSLTAYLTVPFTLHTLISGLVPGTSYWLDLAGSASAGTVTYKNLNLIAFEV